MDMLIATPDPGALLPDVLPCPPLDLLVALHQQVTRTMLSDLAHAQRAAAAAQAIAQRFPDDALLQAQAHWSQGSAILYVPDYTHALAHYDAALEWYTRACAQLAPATPARDIRVVQIVRVFCLSELGRYAEAQQAVAAAQDWIEHNPGDYPRLTLLLNRSQLAGAMGKYNDMVELADQTISLASSLDEPARVAQGWINRAFACISLGRFAEADEALDCCSEAATRAEEPLTAARALVNRAWLRHCQGQLFAALTLLRQAQPGLVQAEGELATIALEEAVIYEQLRQLPEAQRAARFASEQFALQAMPTYSASAALRAARIAMQQRQANAARALLHTAMEQAQQAALPTLDAEIALTEAALATLPAPALAPRALTRSRRAARDTAQRAVAVLQAHGAYQEALAGRLTLAALDALLGERDAALNTYRDLSQLDNHQIQLAAHAALGNLLPPAEALPHLRRAATLAVEQRRRLPMEELQARYSSETSPYHTQLAACYLALSDETQAFESVCVAKAGPLLDLRAASGSLDSQTYTLLERAKADIARLREQVEEQMRKAQHAAQAQQHERATYHDQQARAIAETLQASEQHLTETLRTLGHRSQAIHIPALADIQHALPRGMVLLEYVQIGADLGCFLAQPEAISYRRLGDYRALAPLLDRWSLVCRRVMDDQLAANAHQQIQMVLAPLWNVLIAAWEHELAQVQELLIAPCGILHHVPWAMLWNGEQYLGDRYTLTLTPCGALWAAPVDAAPVAPGPARLLGYAGSGERYLPHVAAEIDSIARKLAHAQVAQAATSDDLRAAPPPSLLHIAAHGSTNAAAPLCSTIDLADGPFLLLEAHRLDLRGTALVTLSACETSVRPDHGDMALALAGAFLCAGAQAVLASLWQVADDATASLMEHFYGALATGMPAAHALQQAQQQLRVTHPLDWASFQIWAGTR
jgi:CHAT domain-containing protein